MNIIAEKDLGEFFIQDNKTLSIREKNIFAAKLLFGLR